MAINYDDDTKAEAASVCNIATRYRPGGFPRWHHKHR